MKKFLIRGAAVLVVLVALVYAFRDQIFTTLEPFITAEMFVAEDTDAFDPGLPVGAQFPPIRALYRDREITGIDEFIGTRGAVFVANRSTDW